MKGEEKWQDSPWECIHDPHMYYRSPKTLVPLRLHKTDIEEWIAEMRVTLAASAFLMAHVLKPRAGCFLTLCSWRVQVGG